MTRALVETGRLRNGDHPLSVAVNVSARNVSAPDFASTVIGRLRRLYARLGARGLLQA